jgi:predicted lipid-binding transport protein (Tim44 family)
MAVADGRQLRDRSTGTLVRELMEQLTRLARQEVELAKAEMAEKGRKAGLGAGLLSGAAIAGLFFLGTFTAFLVLALAEGMDGWLAALIVAVLWAAVALVLALVGRQKVQDVGAPVPEKTVESVKEDIEWLKGQKS